VNSQQLSVNSEQLAVSSHRKVVVKIVLLQSFENQQERIHQYSNSPKSGYNKQ